MGDVTHYDLVIIGAGSGNMIAGREFASLDVATIEERLFGGTCLNVGCIPTKMYVYPADLIRGVGHLRDLGVTAHVDAVDWPAIRDRIFGRIDPMPADARAWRQSLPRHTVYDTHARFTGLRTLAVADPDGGADLEVTADQIVVAAGSRVNLPELPGLDSVPYETSDTIMRLDALPERMVIVGAGIVAAEFAHVFSAFGTQVTQVVRGDRLLRGQDHAISDRFAELAAGQWDLRTGHRPVRVAQDADGITVTLDDGSAVSGDVLLLATGRVPNSDRLDVAAGGIETADDGVIVVDEFQRTNVPGVWALGDIANRFELKHVANHEARVIRHNLLNPDDLLAADHSVVPGAIFSSPQIAYAGLTEERAVEAGLSFVTSVHPYADVAYGWAMEDRGHFVKLVADPRAGTILGAHIIGPDASTLIQPLVQAMSLGTSVTEMARGQFWIHPALTEVVENALLGLRLDD